MVAPSAAPTAWPQQGRSPFWRLRVTHLHVRVEALLPPLLPVALGIEGQLVGAHLHLACRQEPRAAAVVVSVAGGGRGDGGPQPQTPRLRACGCGVAQGHVEQPRSRGGNLPQSTPGAKLTLHPAYIFPDFLYASVFLFANLQCMMPFALFYSQEFSLAASCMAFWVGHCPDPHLHEPGSQLH